MASGIFLHITDRDIRNRKSFYKNMDNLMGGSKTLEGLERKLRIFLEVCRSRNMKLQPSKFTLGRLVVFGGCAISSKSDKVLINPGKEKTNIINSFEVPKCRKIFKKN